MLTLQKKLQQKKMYKEHIIHKNNNTFPCFHAHINQHTIPLKLSKTNYQALRTNTNFETKPTSVSDS